MKKSELIFRKAEINDLGFIYELMKSHLGKYFENYTKTGWSRHLFKDKLDINRLTIIEHEGMPIGFFDYELKDHVYFHNLHISEDYQNKGIGTYALESVEEAARKNNLKELRGKVFKENTNSLNWLKKTGWIICNPIEEEDSYWVVKKLV